MDTIPKLNGLFVSLDDLRDQLEETALSGFTRNEARRLLVINSSTMAWLSRNGWLIGTTVKHHRNRRPITLISREALEDVLENYATLCMMAASARTQAIHVARKLEDASIFPLDLECRLSKIYPRTSKLERIFDPGGIPESLGK